MASRCRHCGVELAIEPWMAGKTLECPACRKRFVLPPATGDGPVAQARPFRPLSPQPTADAESRAVDPGGLGLPPYLRNYGRVGVALFGLLLVGLFFVPLDLDVDARPVFWWTPGGNALTVAIVLLCLGAMALAGGMALRGPALGLLAFGAGVGGALTWYFVLRPAWGHWGAAMPVAGACLLVGIPVAMIGLRLRSIFERGVMGRVWLVPGLALLVLGCVWPIAGRMPIVASLSNIQADAQAGTYIGAGLALLFGAISLLPGGAGSGMMGFTGLLLGVLSPFVRGIVEGAVRLYNQVRAENAALEGAGVEPRATFDFTRLLDEVLLSSAFPMILVLSLLMLTVFGGVLLLGAVTLRPKSPTVEVVGRGH